MTLKFSKHLIEKVKEGIVRDVFVEMTEKNKKSLQKIGALDEYGAMLNRKTPVTFSAWEDSSSVNTKVTIKVKPGRKDCGVNEDELYYVLRVEEING